MNEDRNKEKKITFHLDSTRDFAIALQAKSQLLDGPKTAEVSEDMVSSIPHDDRRGDNNESMVDVEEEPTLNELSAELDETLLGSSANSITIGRGLATVISLLKHTGEITGRNAGREEMKGRAKDAKTYEDYEKLDLKDVVKIDRSGKKGAPHEKDLEYANREIKLDYRDEHGRLLTRKEAYRNLCYQFHGYGSGKKNQERRLKQIERERLEKASSSKLESKSTLTALKATQKATGKAFVVHKT
jgi:U4/U6.U5 tri-snRNP-associated protein 1